MPKELEHVGVLGMHWGIRKGRLVNVDSADSKKARAISKKSIGEMSNEDLRTVITRKQLEKQYKDISKGQLRVGQRLFQDLLLRFVNVAAAEYINSKKVPRQAES